VEISCIAEIGRGGEACPGEVERAQQGLDSTCANALPVKLELQAECYAGVRGSQVSRSRKILEAGDIEAALHAASVIGDNALQTQAQGNAVPASFTHGISQQRVAWFRRGIEGSRLQDSNTFQ
jgi:hypothetical protein